MAAHKKGVLPIPILVTEPAVGYGGGPVLAYFSRSLAEGADTSGQSTKFSPPLIAAAAGFYTSDGSSGGGLLLFWPFRDDQFRYLGALGVASFNLDFFGFDPDGALADDPVAYALDPRFVVQRLQARLKRTALFAGAHYLYMHTKTTFDGTLPGDVPPRDLKLSLGGLGASLELDTRDNLLDAKRGVDVTASGTWYGDAFGSDLACERYQVQGLFYWQPSRTWGYGLRVDTRFSSGDAPFFMKPFLSMRGLASAEYANDVTLLTEGELRYSIDSRWTILSFGGAGRVGGDVRRPRQRSHRRCRGRGVPVSHRTPARARVRARLRTRAGRRFRLVHPDGSGLAVSPRSPCCRHGARPRRLPNDSLKPEPHQRPMLPGAPPAHGVRTRDTGRLPSRR